MEMAIFCGKNVLQDKLKFVCDAYQLETVNVNIKLLVLL
jgi:hypothetical protein